MESHQRSSFTRWTSSRFALLVSSVNNDRTSSSCLRSEVYQTHEIKFSKFLRPSQLDSVLKLQIPSPRSCDRSRKNRLQDGGKRNLEDENSCATCFSRAGIFNVFLFPLCLCTNPQSSMSLAKHEPLSLDVRLMFVYIQIKPAQSLSLLSSF